MISLNVSADHRDRLLFSLSMTQFLKSLSVCLSIHLSSSIKPSLSNKGVKSAEIFCLSFSKHLQCLKANGILTVQVWKDLPFHWQSYLDIQGNQFEALAPDLNWEICLPKCVHTCGHTHACAHTQSLGSVPGVFFCLPFIPVLPKQSSNTLLPD